MMENYFKPYAFKNFTDWSDEGAKMTLVFAFNLTGKELTRLEEQKPALAPHIESAFANGPSSICVYSNPTKSQGGPNIKTIKRDVGAIFATIAHLVVGHRHELSISVGEVGNTKTEGWSHTPEQFMNFVSGDAIQIDSDAAKFLQFAIKCVVPKERISKAKIFIKIGTAPPQLN